MSDASIEKLESRRLFAAGDIDHTFGIDGRVADEVNANEAIDDALLVAGDKVLVAGAMNPDPSSAGDPNYMVRRYNADGSLDTSFADDGIATGRFVADTAVRIIELHPTTGGKFVTLSRNWSGDDFPKPVFIARFNADGSLDNTFSSDGWLAHSATSDGVTMAVQPDGAVLIAVEGDLTRYTAAGALDTSFGDNGTVTEALGDNGWMFDIKPQSDGTILIGGYAPLSETDSRFALAKLNADGSRVTAFGDDGIVVTLVNPSGAPERFEIIRDLLVLPDGKILANGEAGGALGVVRYLPDGDVDASFGDNGRKIIYGGGNFTRAYLDQEQRVYLTAGSFITRLTADGDIDQTFGRVYGGADHRSADTYFDGNVAGFDADGNIVIAGVRDTFHHSEIPSAPDEKHIVTIHRLIEDDGNPSPITLSGGILTMTATGNNDYLHSQDFRGVVADVNGDGRVFELADVNLIACDGAGGDDLFRFDDIKLTRLHLKGGDGRDQIFSGDKNDTLEGNAQRDVIYGGNGADLIIGNGGNDKLSGQGGWDHMYGGAGTDGVQGNGGRDRISGGAGSDILVGDESDDTFLAADGEVDQLFGDDGNDSATVDEDDALSSIESTN